MTDTKDTKAVKAATAAEKAAAEKAKLVAMRRAAELIAQDIRGDLASLKDALASTHQVKVADGKGGRFVCKGHGLKAEGSTERVAIGNWGNAARRALNRAA